MGRAPRRPTRYCHYVSASGQGRRDWLRRCRRLLPRFSSPRRNRLHIHFRLHRFLPHSQQCWRHRRRHLKWRRNSRSQLSQTDLYLAPPLAVRGFLNAPAGKSRLRALRRLCGPRCRRRRRVHGRSHSRPLRSGKIRRRLHDRNSSQLPGILPATQNILMIYPIVKFGNPVLEKPSEAVTVFDDDLQKLLDDMFESMYATHGVGLAAPQIGIARRIAVIDVTFKEDPEAKLVLINPEIIHTEGKHTQSEGCLSIPEFRENVTRPSKVTVRAQDARGKVFEKTGDELLARALLHETDHLNGKLYISHISALKRDLIKRKIRKLIKAGEW